MRLEIRNAAEASSVAVRCRFASTVQKIFPQQYANFTESGSVVGPSYFQHDVRLSRLYSPSLARCNYHHAGTTMNSMLHYQHLCDPCHDLCATTWSNAHRPYV